MFAELEQAVNEQASRRNGEVAEVVLRRLREEWRGSADFPIEDGWRFWTVEELKKEPVGAKFRHSIKGEGEIIQWTPTIKTMRWKQGGCEDYVPISFFTVANACLWRNPMQKLVGEEKPDGLCDHARLFTVHAREREFSK